jgi:hypothetical protein
MREEIFASLLEPFLSINFKSSIYFFIAYELSEKN